MNSITCPQCGGDGSIRYEDLGQIECPYCTSVKSFPLPTRCNVCSGKMVKGTALVNTLLTFADFGDDAGGRGTTQTRKGPAILVDVLKCEDCGHSFSI